MKKLILAAAAGAAAIGLSACSDADTVPAADETTVITDEVPTATETTVVTDELPDETVDGSDSFTVSEDGVTADIDEGDASIEADIDEDPSATVTTD